MIHSIVSLEILVLLRLSSLPRETTKLTVSVKKFGVLDALSEVKIIEELL